MLNALGGYNNISSIFGPVKFTDFINEKMDKIHSLLYEDALNSFKNFYKTKFNIDLNDVGYKIIEKKPDTFLEPSTIIVIAKVYPYERRTFDLKYFWCSYYQICKLVRTYTNLYISEDTLKDAKIIYLDYVNGKGKLRSRYTGEEFWVDFNFIDGSTQYDEDMSLKNTFSYKYKNEKKTITT